MLVVILSSYVILGIMMSTSEYVFGIVMSILVYCFGLPFILVLGCLWVSLPFSILVVMELVIGR